MMNEALGAGSSTAAPAQKPIVSPWTLLINRVKVISNISEELRAKFEFKEENITFSQDHEHELVPGGDGRRNKTMTSAETEYLGKTFEVGWFENKKSARDKLAMLLVTEIDNPDSEGPVPDGLGRVECASTSTLQGQPVQDQKWWERLAKMKGVGKKKKSRNSREKRREVLLQKYPPFFKYVFISCSACKVLNYKKYDHCSRCNSEL